VHGDCKHTGFGDIVPETGLGKALVCIYALLGLGMLALLVSEVSAILTLSASEKITTEKEKIIISNLDDKLSWMISDSTTHIKLRYLQLSLSPLEFRDFVDKLKIELENYYEELSFGPALPLNVEEEEKKLLLREKSLHELHLSRSRSRSRERSKSRNDEIENPFFNNTNA
jgi:hypothetical protein